MLQGRTHLQVCIAPIQTTNSPSLTCVKVDTSDMTILEALLMDPSEEHLRMEANIPEATPGETNVQDVSEAKQPKIKGGLCRWLRRLFRRK